MTRIVVSGMIAAVPGQGGATWAVLQYLLGFARLGHEVFFVEAVDPEVLQPADVPLLHSVNARYCRQVMKEHGLEDAWALVRRDTQETAGLSHSDLARIGAGTSVLVDISGTLAGEELFSRVPVRVYLDVDPGFTQLWDAQGLDVGLAGHTHFVTVGQSLGSLGCPVPTGGRTWITTWPPVVLDEWPVGHGDTGTGFTTVANWRSYGSVELDGVQYGQKVHSFRPLMALPTRTEERFLLALAIDPAEAADVAALRANRWELLDPGEVAGSPSAYREFVQRSKAELGIAKSGYVLSRSGWFSDRSVCYLASGRPVLAQDTGLSRHLPTGAGLLAFDDLEDALAGVAEVAEDRARHSAAARSLAEAHFDSARVLRRLLREVDAT
ncbi:glycosyltransferase family protein [Geodermatophilus sp. SYSU D01105]